MHALVMVALLVLSGCAVSQFGGVASGGALYSYSRTKDGCNVGVSSAREVSDIDLNIDKDCSLSISIGSTKGDQAAEILDRITKLPGLQQ